MQAFAASRHDGHNREVDRKVQHQMTAWSARPTQINSTVQNRVFARRSLIAQKDLSVSVDIDRNQNPCRMFSQEKKSISLDQTEIVVSRYWQFCPGLWFSRRAIFRTPWLAPGEMDRSKPSNCNVRGAWKDPAGFIGLGLSYLMNFGQVRCMMILRYREFMWLASTDAMVCLQHFFTITLLVLQGSGLAPPAQTPPAAGDQLDLLRTPVALHSYSLLTQITTSSTSPKEIQGPEVVNIDTWLQHDPRLTCATFCGKELNESESSEIGSDNSMREGRTLFSTDRR